MDDPLDPTAAAPVARVLLVEDCTTDAVLVQRHLSASRDTRFAVTLARSLAEALAALEPVPGAGGEPAARPVDCVLLDLALPDTVDLEGLAAIRGHAPDVAVIVLTGRDDDELGEAALHLGAQDFIAKDDVTAPILRRAVRHAMARQQDRRLLESTAAELARQVAERRDAEAARERALAELERSNADLSEFAYVAAHDLRSPLGVVAGYAELLADLPQVASDPEAAELVAQVRGGVVQLQSLVDGLLAFCAVGTARLRRQPVDLNEVVADVTLAVTRRRPCDINPGPLPTVEGDPVQLRQLLDNLIGNAVKYVPPDRMPRVDVLGRQTPDGWEIVVADNGIGIPEHQRERVFAMFQRLRDLEGVEGTGIGLAICRRVVEHHGGRIWIEDNRPVGTRVRFTLPAAVPAAPAAPAPAPPAEAAPRGVGRPRDAATSAVATSSAEVCEESGAASVTGTSGAAPAASSAA